MPADIAIRRRNRKQTGQVIEKPTAFYIRYYVTTAKGERQKVWKKLCDKSAKYQTVKDVAPLVEQELATNGQPAAPRASQKITDFVESVYLPWVKQNKSAATENGYRKLWEQHWKPTVGHVGLIDLRTESITDLLTEKAKAGLGRNTLGHLKWFLSGVFGFAEAKGIVPAGHNPVVAAKWLCKVARPKKQKEYSLDEMRAMLAILKQLDIRAAVAVALAYFAALRPAEIRGLQWADFDGEHLNIRRAVWRNAVGDTKTEDSAALVFVIEPLRGLLEQLRNTPIGEATDGERIPTYGDMLYILDGGKGRPISLDSLNFRVIAPALKGKIEWRGYYPGRRGISSLITDTSNNALNSTGLLRHSTPITALKHYTRAQKSSIEAALKSVEKLATAPAN